MNKLPSRKVPLGAAVNGSIGLLAWILNDYVLSKPIPAEVAIGFATVITGIIQYAVADVQSAEG